MQARSSRPQTCVAFLEILKHTGGKEWLQSSQASSPLSLLGIGSWWMVSDNAFLHHSPKRRRQVTRDQGGIGAGVGTLVPRERSRTFPVKQIVSNAVKCRYSGNRYFVTPSTSVTGT